MFTEIKAESNRLKLYAKESRARQQLSHGSNAINQEADERPCQSINGNQNSLLSPRGCHTTQLMIHGQQEITDQRTIETNSNACFPSPRIDNSPRSRSCRTPLDQAAQRAGVATSASRKMVECKVQHLDDGAEGNARQAKTNEVGVLVAG